MIREKSKNNVLGIAYFHELFAKRKHLFPALYFFYPIETFNKKVEVPRLLHKKIVTTYLDIYFNELYHQNIPKYFPLSGKLQKAKGKAVYRQKNNVMRFGRGIIWLWYYRPSVAYISNIVLKKSNACKDKTYRLEQRFRIEHDVELLPHSVKLSKELLQTNKLFKT